MPGGALSNVTILIVEDQADSRILITEFLNRHRAFEHPKVENASRMRNSLLVMELTQSVNDHSLSKKHGK
jgi:hypothetical protein